MREAPLDLSRRRIENIPFSDIPANTAWLILSNNVIRRIPREIEKFRKVERLALNDNSISEVSESLQVLSRLSWVDMTRNRLKTLPSGLAFTHLVGLGLSENEFEEIPECVYNFQALRKFGFFANKIRFVSPRIQNLRNLVKLDLSNNLIEELPDEICTLRSLAWLNISNNKLKRLPKNFGELVNLEELGLGNNCLEHLPSLSNMKRLKVLSAFGNELREFAIESQSVRKVDLSGNRLECFPTCLLRVPTLHTVSLKNNAIEKIAMRSAERSNLRSVDIRFNKLKSLPLKFLKSIEGCQALLLEGNDFTIKKDVFPDIPSLQSICLGKYINTDIKAENSVRSKSVCDCCGRFFVSEPIKMYFLASLEHEDKFCLEEEVCTNRCYVDSIKIKSCRSIFCSRT